MPGPWPRMGEKIWVMEILDNITPPCYWSDKDYSLKIRNWGIQMNANQDLFNDIEKVVPAHTDQGSNPDAPAMDEIIDLIDVVQEAEMAPDPGDGETLYLGPEEPDDFLVKVTGDDIPEEPTPQSVAEKEPDDPPEEDAFSALESPDFQFENSPAFEEDDAKPFSEPPHEDLDDVLAGLEKEGTEAESPEDILANFEEMDEAEKPDDVPAGLEEKDEIDEKPEERAESLCIPGISEEKMKEILTEVIQDTVDKAIRETVSEVAEKVILEAIEGLKQSIESSRE